MLRCLGSGGAAAVLVLCLRRVKDVRGAKSVGKVISVFSPRVRLQERDGC